MKFSPPTSRLEGNFAIGRREDQDYGRAVDPTQVLSRSPSDCIAEWDLPFSSNGNAPEHTGNVDFSGPRKKSTANQLHLGSLSVNPQHTWVLSTANFLAYPKFQIFGQKTDRTAKVYGGFSEVGRVRHSECFRFVEPEHTGKVDFLRGRKKSTPLGFPSRQPRADGGSLRGLRATWQGPTREIFPFRHPRTEKES